MAVQDALTHALNLWKQIAPKEYTNGAVVFCSKELAEIFHPPTPLRGRLYDCGRQFNTSVIQNAIDAELGSVYGLIVVDGSDAAFGKVQGLGTRMASGPVISDLGHLGAHIAGRTRRGGQSALRYARLRDESELAFLRKVAERAAALLMDISGVIIAGKADMKHKLAAELPEHLRKQIICIVDLSCNAGSESLRQAALRAAEAVASAENEGVDRELQNFFDLTLRDSMCCYCEVQTLQALEMGAVEHLLLSANLQTKLSVDEWKVLADMHGTRVIEILPNTEKGSQFCQSYGVGGCLRWPLDMSHFEDLNDEQDELQEVNVTPHRCSGAESVQAIGPIHKSKSVVEGACEEIDCESASTMDSTGVDHVELHRSEALAWFQAEVKEVLGGDSSTAETLATCVEVVLSDEETPQEEILEGLLGILSAEGVPEEIGVELMRRW
jgi:peptide subunit release factor 1 (eRF1)